MTYLTKQENGRTHHFRVTIENTGVDIVEGVFYNWLTKRWVGCGDIDNAEIKMKELISEKLKEGFQETKFLEMLENTVDVYDKAKWHFGGDFPTDLDDFQGYVHTGMFLGWLIDKDLISDDFKENNKTEIQEFRNRKMTGSQVFEKCCDGVLMIEDINELGNRFSLSYFDFQTGQYLTDYENALLKGKPSLYNVDDTWDNYAVIKLFIEKRFADWNDKNSKKSK